MFKVNNSVHEGRLLKEVQEETGWNNKKPGDAWIMKHQISSIWDWHLA